MSDLGRQMFIAQFQSMGMAHPKSKEWAEYVAEVREIRARCELLAQELESTDKEDAAKPKTPEPGGMDRQAVVKELEGIRLKQVQIHRWATTCGADNTRALALDSDIKLQQLISKLSEPAVSEPEGQCGGDELDLPDHGAYAIDPKWRPGRP